MCCSGDVCVQCGVCFVRGGVWCVVCLLVCVWSVCNAAWHAGKPPVCRFKTSPCVRSKRLRVYRQNARMLNRCARFAGTHPRRLECTHVGVLDGHTERGHRQFCLPREAHGEFSLAPERFTKETLGSYSFVKFENRSRTTCSRFLQSFALPGC